MIRHENCVGLAVLFDISSLGYQYVQAFSSRIIAMSGISRWTRGPWNTDADLVVSMNTRKKHFATCISLVLTSMGSTTQILPGSQAAILTFCLDDCTIRCSLQAFDRLLGAICPRETKPKVVRVKLQFRVNRNESCDNHVMCS
jgi:hypothetical protein